MLTLYSKKSAVESLQFIIIGITYPIVVLNILSYKIWLHVYRDESNRKTPINTTIATYQNAFIPLYRTHLLFTLNPNNCGKGDDRGANIRQTPCDPQHMFQRTARNIPLFLWTSF